MIEQDYQIVIDSTGKPYLDAEQRLISQGGTADSFLREKLGQADPQARRIIQIILEWLSENETFVAVMDYFKRVEKRASTTAMRVPPADGVATYLAQNFGKSAAELLGVYLLKLFPIWPKWQTSGVILYFGKLDSSASAETLIRLIVTTPNDSYRQLAVTSLVAVGDENVLDKIEDQLNFMALPQNALQQAAKQIRESTET